MVARVFPLGRSGAAEQTETVIATFQARQGTLVVVDDHARFREAVTERLAAAGWRIVGEAAAGAAAIDLVACLPPTSSCWMWCCPTWMGLPSRTGWPRRVARAR